MFTESHLNDHHLFTLVFEQAPIGMAIVTPEGRMQKVNKSLCRMLGYGQDELIGQQFQSSTHPEDLDLNLDLLQKALAGEIDSYEMTKRFFHKSGRVIWVLLNASLVRDEIGNPSYLISQLMDITEQKQMEEELRENEQRYKSFIQNAPVAICSVDLMGNLIEVNPAFENMMGQTREELLSINYMEFILPERTEIARKKFESSFRQPLNFDQFFLKRKNGSLIDAVAVSSPIILNGEPVGVYFMIRDFTQERQTDELLKNQEKLLLVGELAAGIAHEIRNPLTSLRGFIQLFKSEDTEGVKRPRHEIMLSEIDRINEIVGELLMLAKPSQGQYDQRSISGMLNDVITLLEAQANLLDIEIKKEFDSELPLVLCNSSIKQVFINLLKNAMESMPHGGEIFIQAKRVDDQVCIRIKDQGGGIPQDQLLKIGQPFYTTKETGTGLGLMVSQRIIQNHRGSMRIESKVGRGTIVEITI